MRYGKTEAAEIMAVTAAKSGRRVIFMTPDIPQAIRRLSRRTPGALFEIVGECGIILHLRRRPHATETRQK